jgi:hypothetical protein
MPPHTCTALNASSRLAGRGKRCSLDSQCVSGATHELYNACFTTNSCGRSSRRQVAELVALSGDAGPDGEGRGGWRNTGNVAPSAGGPAFGIGVSNTAPAYTMFCPPPSPRTVKGHTLLVYVGLPLGCVRNSCGGADAGICVHKSCGATGCRGLARRRGGPTAPRPRHQRAGVWRATRLRRPRRLERRRARRARRHAGRPRRGRKGPRLQHGQGTQPGRCAMRRRVEQGSGGLSRLLRGGARAAALLLLWRVCLLLQRRQATAHAVLQWQRGAGRGGGGLGGQHC